MNPFDFVNAVTALPREDIMVDDVAEKSYSPFLTNKSLSHHQDCIMYVNEMRLKISPRFGSTISLFPKYFEKEKKVC